MSNLPGNAQDAPLFQNMDEQEAVYAPQQVPGSNIPDAELDQGGSAGETTAGAAGAVAATNVGGVGNPGGVTSASGPGASGVGAVTPVVPVRPDTSANTPIIAPSSSYRDANDGDMTGTARS